MRRISLSILAALLCLASCNKSLTRVNFQGNTQGTYYSISYYDEQGRNFQPQVDSLLAEFDTVANLWVECSEIRRVNRNEDSVVSVMFMDLLSKSLNINEYTQGAFNCFIGSLVNLYGFGFRNRTDATEAQVDSLLTLAHCPQLKYSPIVVAGDTTSYTLTKNAHVEMDFNAIAQGYVVDLIAQMFDDLGLESYLVDVGGEVIAKGKKPNGESWTVGIERPATDKYSQQEVEIAICLDNQSVVTSGNYRKYYEKDGVRYSHTIDPATGHPVNHSLLSVSVVSRESWMADAMATSFMVMGMDKALEFIQSHPDDPDIQAVFFIYDQAGEYQTYATPAFQKIIKTNNQ